MILPCYLDIRCCAASLSKKSTLGLCFVYSTISSSVQTELCRFFIKIGTSGCLSLYFWYNWIMYDVNFGSLCQLTLIVPTQLFPREIFSNTLNLFQGSREETPNDLNKQWHVLLGVRRRWGLVVTLRNVSLCFTLQTKWLDVSSPCSWHLPIL